jgi:F-type H+-transporting ATPase subunit gamma
MISPRILRRRIRSIQSTAKITRAMEMIATTKMKRSQDQALSGRPYDQKITQLISDLAAESAGSGAALHPLLQSRRTIKKIAVLHITSNRGLCGGFNSNMNQMTGNFITEQKSPVALVTVGRKGTDFMSRCGREIKAEFSDISDRPKLIETLPISRVIIDDYTSGEIDLVYLAYTDFVNTFTQKAVMHQLLPIVPAVLPKTSTREFIYEPDAATVLDGLLPRFIEMKVYHAILESVASEQSARMIAMRNATDNANEFIEHLTLILNKARQEMITTELLDISGGVEVLQ